MWASQLIEPYVTSGAASPRNRCRFCMKGKKRQLPVGKPSQCGHDLLQYPLSHFPLLYSQSHPVGLVWPRTRFESNDYYASVEFFEPDIGSSLV